MIKCPVCGEYYYDNPDETECANVMSLNEARAAWAQGKAIE